MQSIFPYLLSWSLIVPFILRIVGGAYFIYFGYRGMTSEWQNKLIFFREIHFKPYEFYAYVITIAELLGGIMLLMGFMTQLVALIFFIICIVGLLIQRSGTSTIERDLNVYVLLAAIMLSLFISGAGYYAIDLMI
ncbi:MAG: DoxX family protein [Patescibacteria group bacterium]